MKTVFSLLYGKSKYYNVLKKLCMLDTIIDCEQYCYKFEQLFKYFRYYI